MKYTFHLKNFNDKGHLMGKAGVYFDPSKPVITDVLAYGDNGVWMLDGPHPQVREAIKALAQTLTHFMPPVASQADSQPSAIPGDVAPGRDSGPQVT
jgi:hypothetical protein